MLNHVLGTKFRIVEGYKGIRDAALAIERGEVEGVCMSYAQFNDYQHLIRDGKLRILLHAEETPIPEIPQVPSIYDVRQDRRAAPALALRVLERGIRAALRVAARGIGRPRRAHAQGVRRSGAGTRRCWPTPRSPRST